MGFDPLGSSFLVVAPSLPDSAALLLAAHGVVACRSYLGSQEAKRNCRLMERESAAAAAARHTADSSQEGSVADSKNLQFGSWAAFAHSCSLHYFLLASNDYPEVVKQTEAAECTCSPVVAGQEVRLRHDLPAVAM